jgi:hypothetical protein
MAKLCPECGIKSDNAETCPKDGVKLVPMIIADYELLEKLSSDVATVTYSARHRHYGRSNLKITLRERTDAEAAEEFIQYARATAKIEAPNGGTMDLGLTDDGTYMFVVFDPNARDEVQNATIENKILMTEAVLELLNKRQQDQS